MCDATGRSHGTLSTLQRPEDFPVALAPLPHSDDPFDHSLLGRLFDEERGII